MSVARLIAAICNGDSSRWWPKEAGELQGAYETEYSIDLSGDEGSHE